MEEARRAGAKILLEPRREGSRLWPIVATDVPAGAKFYYGRGCDRCNNTGHKGRVGIFELIIINDDLQAIKQIPTNSSTLLNPSHLEATVRSGGAGLISQIQPNFTQVYGAIPQPADAQARERNMMDMDDAVAMGSLKTTMISDQTSQTMLALADSLEQQTATAAPGSADFLSTQVRIANLENQAYLAKMLATELRQSAAHLAHENAELKKGADSTRLLRIQMQQLLTRP